MRIIAASVFVFMLASRASAADVDWKFYDEALLDGPSGGYSLCFYDAKTVAQASSGYIRVWTKCLAAEDFSSVLRTEGDVGDDLVDKAERRLRTGYVPPIIEIGERELKNAPWIAAAEEFADGGTVASQVQLFAELNCGERMSRRLAISIPHKGERAYDQKPSDWQYVLPESGYATLLKILCPKQ
jgi:hypothetical protein